MVRKNTTTNSDDINLQENTDQLIQDILVRASEYSEIYLKKRIRLRNIYNLLQIMTISIQLSLILILLNYTSIIPIQFLDMILNLLLISLPCLFIILQVIDNHKKIAEDVSDSYELLVQDINFILYQNKV